MKNVRPVKSDITGLQILFSKRLSFSRTCDLRRNAHTGCQPYLDSTPLGHEIEHTVPRFLVKSFTAFSIAQCSKGWRVALMTVNINQRNVEPLLCDFKSFRDSDQHRSFQSPKGLENSKLPCLCITNSGPV